MLTSQINSRIELKRKSVLSRAIRSVGYNSKRKILEIEFKSGTLYQYYSVPEFEVKYLLAAKSIGACFNKNIKDRPYSYIKLY